MACFSALSTRQSGHNRVMDDDKLWTARDLAFFLVYTESAVKRMVTDMPNKLPPRVDGLGKPRWHPDVVKQWAVDQNGEINTRVGRPRNIA